MSIPSPFRIPSSDLGVSPDQRAVDAFLEGRQNQFWGFNGSPKKMNNDFGFFFGFGAFALYYEKQLFDPVKRETKTVRCFRNPDHQFSPDYWSTLEEFKPLKPVKAEYNWFPPAMWWNEVKAARQTSYNDSSRFVKIPYDPDFVKLPPVPDPQHADNGYLVDRDESGSYGIETLGIRQMTEPMMNYINNVLCNGVAVCNMNDYILDGAVRRTPENALNHKGRGCGNIPKRVGLLTPDDLLLGWDESKAAVFPNVQFGPGAKAQPGYRVEHTEARQRRSEDAYPMGDHRLMIMHGTRLTPTRPMEGPNGIKRWADDEGFTGDLKKSAITNAVGASEFGVTCSDTGYGQAGCEAVGRDYNPIHREGFDRAGVKSSLDAWRLMRNLFIKNYMVVNNAPPIGAKK